MIDTAIKILIDSTESYTKRNGTLFTDTLEAEVINNACLYILRKKRKVELSNNEIIQITFSFVDAASTLFPDNYKEAESQVALISIPQNCEWPGMWAFLKDYFQEKHDENIEGTDVVPEHFHSESHERYEKDTFITKTVCPRIVKLSFSEDKEEVLVSIEPTLSPKPAKLESTIGSDKLIYRGLDKDYRFEIHLNKFESVKEFVLERLDTGLKLRYL